MVRTHPLWYAVLEDCILKFGTNGSVLATLATTRQHPSALQGRPSCRTINIRKFDAMEQTLTFCSDTRSDKLRSDGQYATAEVCIYVAGSSIQFRLSGLLHAKTVNDHDHAVEIGQWWASLTDREKIWFMWPNPGHARTGACEQHYQKERHAEELKPVPAHFAICEFAPDFVDICYLAKMPYERVWYTKQRNSWFAQSVNP